MTEAVADTAARAKDPPARKVRADSRRNRELLVETAKHAFEELGPQVSLELISRRAGVGIGTLYRHFPDRNALVEAVCRHEVDQLGEAAQSLLETREPGDALHRWMRLCVDYIATKKVLASVVCSALGIPEGAYRTSVAQITDNPVFGSETEIYRSTTERLTGAIGLLTERAIAAGAIRADVTAMDLMHAVAGFTITYGEASVDWQESALRLVDILMDGLRSRG